MEGLLAGLNRAQREAVTSEASVLQVLAPPGSGKTKTLTARVGWLINEGLDPSSIVVCTFTVKAANEMQERIGMLVGETKRKRLNIGTFHGVALKILKIYRREAGLGENFDVADSADSLGIVKRICKAIDASMDAKQARNRISTLKSKGIDCDAYAAQSKNNSSQQEFLSIFRDYQDSLKIENLLDFDDILLSCVSLLQQHPHCVSHIKAVLVDEFQDTNGVQYELMSLLAQRHNFITIVGDPDQSIYGWRSAEIKNLGRMKERWRDTLTINLEENYRSSGGILHAAQIIIEQDENRPPKKLQATHSFGHKPILRRLPSSKDEATWIVEEIQRVQALTGGLFRYDDISILLRSASLSRLIEHALTANKIPYRMVGGMRFYDRKEIQIILDYMRVMNSTTHGEALCRVLNVPGRGIGEATVTKLQAEAESKRTTLWDVITCVTHGSSRLRFTAQIQRGLSQFENVILKGRKRLAGDPTSLAGLIDFLTEKIGFEAYLKKTFAEDFESRWQNVQELHAQAGDASIAEQALLTADADTDDAADGSDLRAVPNTDLAPDETPLNRFLSNAALAAKSDDNSKAATKNHVVTISTVHAAKGLEWPIVFIPACFNGSIPHSRAEDHDEERRLLYVGMTRAQAMLYLSCPLKDSHRQDTTLSTFLDQSGVSSHFQEQGPVLRTADAVGLAGVLGREAPTSAEIAIAAATLERELDDRWPLNGEAPFGYIDEPSGTAEVPIYGKTRTAASLENNGVSKIGFQSLTERFTNLQGLHEQLAEERAKKRFEAASRSVVPSKVRKRQLEGQSTLSWGRPALKRSLTDGSSTALQDVTNTTASTVATTVTPFLPELYTARRMPASVPLLSWKRAKTVVGVSTINPYSFMSDYSTESEEVGRENEPSAATAIQPVVRAANTTHVTSVSITGPGQRRYGMGGPMKPWQVGRKH